jgi:hypothetical protein
MRTLSRPIRRYSVVSAIALLLLVGSVVSVANPITKIVKLSPRYNSNVIEIEFQDAIVGGCTTSVAAVTNSAAANADELTAFLLAAFMSGSNVEVISGGGCDGGLNWIQTIRLVP